MGCACVSGAAAPGGIWKPSHGAKCQGLPQNIPLLSLPPTHQPQRDREGRDLWSCPTSSKDMGLCGHPEGFGCSLAPWRSCCGLSVVQTMEEVCLLGQPRSCPGSAHARSCLPAGCARKRSPEQTSAEAPGRAAAGGAGGCGPTRSRSCSRDAPALTTDRPRPPPPPPPPPPALLPTRQSSSTSQRTMLLTSSGAG